MSPDVFTFDPLRALDEPDSLEFMDTVSDVGLD